MESKTIKLNFVKDEDNKHPSLCLYYIYNTFGDEKMGEIFKSLGQYNVSFNHKPAKADDWSFGIGELMQIVEFMKGLESGE